MDFRALRQFIKSEKCSMVKGFKDFIVLVAQQYMVQ